jgi:hypothetical protein
MKTMDGVRPDSSAAVLEPLSRESFEHRSVEILTFVNELRREWGLQEALRTAAEYYVDDEPQPELARLGQVLVRARQQALLQQQLDEDREALHSGRLQHEERVSTGHHYEMLRREACAYNHELRGLIETDGHYFSRDQLTNWLVEASQGRQAWAQGEITGAVSEVAMHAALAGLPELRDLRYATLDEDLAGDDFMAEWHDQLVTVDAKTGLYRPLTERKHGHKHLEISVPREAVAGFWVTRRGLDLLRHEVRQALER